MKASRCGLPMALVFLASHGHALPHPWEALEGLHLTSAGTSPEPSGESIFRPGFLRAHLGDIISRV